MQEKNQVPDSTNPRKKFKNWSSATRPLFKPQSDCLFAILSLQCAHTCTKRQIVNNYSTRAHCVS